MSNHIKFSPVALIILALSFAGCSSVREVSLPGLSLNAQTHAYTHSGSGLVFPRRIAPLERIAAYFDIPAKGASTVSYSATMTDIPDSRREQLSLFLNANVIVFPDRFGTPAALLKWAQPSGKLFPNLKAEEYRGNTVFGTDRALVSHVSFDRPKWHDRASFKVLVIHRGHYLICFAFQSLASREADWQKEIDRFVSKILAKS